eukprot:6401108-Amphidinium_carterae.1
MKTNDMAVWASIVPQSKMSVTTLAPDFANRVRIPRSRVEKMSNILCALGVGGKSKNLPMRRQSAKKTHT